MIGRIALGTGAAALIVGVGVWVSLEGGHSEQVLPEDGQTQVEGRIPWGSVGHMRDGSSVVSFCEADALVRVDRDTIIEVLEHGERPEIKVGEMLDRDLYEEPTEEYIKERGNPPTLFEIYVYRDGNGVIRRGCPPESIMLVDDVAKPYQEWVDEGKLPKPDSWADQ